MKVEHWCLKRVLTGAAAAGTYPMICGSSIAVTDTILPYQVYCLFSTGKRTLIFRQENF
jgi:hypothetical protein